MSDQTVETSKIEAQEIDPSALKRDHLVHLLLTAWTLVLKQEPASGPPSGLLAPKHPADTHLG